MKYEELQKGIENILHKEIPLREMIELLRWYLNGVEIGIKALYIKPLSTENPFLAIIGNPPFDASNNMEKDFCVKFPPMGFDRMPLKPIHATSKENIKKIQKFASPPVKTKPRFSTWMQYQNVKLKPNDKRYSKYYQRYKREMKKEGRH